MEKVLKNSKAHSGMRAAANAAIVQRKIAIGSVNDPLEKEADVVAEQVMRMPEPDFQRKPLSPSQQNENLISKRPITFISKSVGFNSGTIASDDISDKIKLSKGSGMGLDISTRNFMESRFGEDFSNIKIHTNPEAAKMSQQLNAKAFTHGNDIYFNHSEYNTNSSEGKSLISHELVHTIQQGSELNGKINRKPSSTATATTTATPPSTFVIPGINRMMSEWESHIFISTSMLANPPLMMMLNNLLLTSRLVDVTIGIGIQGGGAYVIGGSVGAGYVIHNGRLGFYGSFTGDLGATVGASLELLFTIVKGGLSNFGGQSLSATAGGGEGVVGHFSVLWNKKSEFLGVAASGGIGAGLTIIEAYVSTSYTFSPDH